MTSMIRLLNPVIRAPRLRLHPRELRYQEFEVKSLVNLPSLIMEKFQPILSPNFNAFFMMVQLP